MRPPKPAPRPLTGKLLRFFCRHGPEMPQIALVTNQHDNDVGICVVPELFQPSRNVVVCLVLADVVNEKRAHSASVVC